MRNKDESFQTTMQEVIQEAACKRQTTRLVITSSRSSLQEAGSKATAPKRLQQAQRGTAKLERVLQHDVRSALLQRPIRRNVYLPAGNAKAL